MAIERISLTKARRDFKSIEEKYFTIAAYFNLLNNEVKNPTEEEILEYKEYLNHTYLGLYILLEKPLTNRQIDILYRASRGEEVSKTAARLNISTNRVLEIRTEVFRRLNANNANHALYKATCAGYLPAYNKEPSMLKKPLTAESL